MFCQYCGKQINEGARFCAYCGKPQEVEGDSRPESPDAQAGLDDQRPAPVDTRQKGNALHIALGLVVALTLVAGAGLIATRAGVLNFNLPLEFPSDVLQLPSLAELLGNGSEADDASNGDAGEHGNVSDPSSDADESDSGQGHHDMNQSGPSSGSEGGSDVSNEGHETDDGKPVGSDGVDSDTSASLELEVVVRAGLSDYSWGELSQIAAEIEACTRSSDALAVAQKYRLVDSLGRYYSTTKPVELSDGKTLQMAVVGVWHDKADTMSGRAGLSFLASNVACRHRMAMGTTTPGGWQGSELRSWLQGDVYQALPHEVSSVILPVHKASNNVGKSTSLSCVTETVDTLWIPSIVELCGPVSWTYSSDPSNSDFYNAVFNAEGVQYEAFAQQRIREDDANDVLSLGSEWWMRSTAASKGRGRYVGTNGDPSLYGDSNEELGVVIGFCL